MKFQVRIGEAAARNVEIERQPAGGLRVRLDGRDTEVDATEIGADTYSILIRGAAFEVHVFPAAGGLLVRCNGQEFRALVQDPRAWRGQRGALFEAEGRQQVTAPMPGKVVRILVAAGDTVQAQQGLVVVEAMKMQNEIRALREGQVERVFVQEGQAVGAGEVLVTIT
jgi:biotin carboxyl carrier protein